MLCTPASPGSNLWPQSLSCIGSDNALRILERDWSHTVLGAIETWPQSLRTTLTTCLATRFPMYLFWGEQLAQFYNDSAGPIMGARDENVPLGTPAQEVFPELFDELGPMFASVMAGAAATWCQDQPLFIERSGFVEETYMTWSYSPVRDESGKVGGILCTILETTRQVVGDRRMQLLRDMAFQTSGESSVEAVFATCLQVLKSNPSDIPFALLHVATGEEHELRCIGTVGVEPSAGKTQEGPCRYDAALHSVISTGQGTALEALPAGIIPSPDPTGRCAPKSLWLIPISTPAQGRIVACLSVGLNPYLKFEAAYADFLTLVGRQMGAAIGHAQVQQEVRERAEQLAALDRAKTTFFSNVSHEFRTPLTLLLGPLEAALSASTGDTAQLPRTALDAAHRNALRLLKLVNTLLDFSRAEAGRVEACLEATDLATYTAELAGQFRSVVEQGGLRLEVIAEKLSAPAYIDREMWEKVTFNLLSNAFKFTFTGAITVRISEDEKDFVLRVSDTGTGIPKADLPKVFERFHRVAGAKSRSFEGSGIGLALVSDLVALQGGIMGVESMPHEGSTFTVRIPRGVPEGAKLKAQARKNATSMQRARAYVGEAERWLAPTDEAIAQNLQDDVSSVSTTARPQVLLLDDNADMRAHVSHLLREHYAVRTASNGVEGLKALEKALPDVIVSDVMMPEMDGFEFLKRVRTAERTRRLPVILISARAGDEATVEGLDAGADDYLVKPFSPRELLARVRTQVTMTALRRDLRTERAAREAQGEVRRLATLLDASRDHVFMLNREGHFVYRNRAFSEAIVNRVGTDEKPIDALAMSRVLGVASEYTQQFEQHVAKVLHGAAVVGQLDIETLRGRRAFEYVLNPVFGEDGSVEYIAGISRDIHDLKAAIKVRDHFMLLASHELKTPLTSLKLQVQLRIRRLRSPAATAVAPEQLTKMFTDDERQVNRLARLVEDMLDISRLNAGKLVLRREPVDLRPLVDEVVERLELQLQALQVPIVVKADAHVTGLWDRTRVEQVVVNLITNAMKYGAGRPIHVEVRDEPEGGRLVVRDTGRGIAINDRERIFGQFERAISASEVSGLGLGLYIVKQIVDAHAGHIEVQSELGAGSCFTVTLPHAAVAAH